MMKTLLFILTLYIFSFNSNASELNKMHLIGKAQMSVLFFDIYDIELLSNTKDWQQNTYPQALKISYLRDISKEDLIKATQEQWQHIKLTNPNQTKWLEKLNDIWPQIQEGNGLTIIVDSNQSSKFYFNDEVQTHQFIGELADPDFGPAFLAIWLSNNTSEPKLRAKLLGKK